MIAIDPDLDLAQEVFEPFRDLIYQQSGIDLKDSKRALLCARISPRVRSLGLRSFRDYFNLVRFGDPHGNELQTLINCITTNKTSFLREPEQFEYLAQQVLAGRVENVRRSGRKVRIWSAACSLGHEPYSIAMVLRDQLPNLADWDVRILASDIDTAVLAFATAARYPLSDTQELPSAFRDRHFLRGIHANEGTVLVRPDIQRLIAFRQINLIAGPWAIRTQFDMIFCRNVMIYFDETTRHTILDHLCDQLLPGGCLFLGNAEAVPRDFGQLRQVARGVYEYQPE